ncbi:polysaccharide deacetylase family protein [Planobispora siamensis]|uniref:NodB homology domain-containing protein n=1 Tax=Planobispora siamensis TaxID=936338 RepID=A0A8J3SB79_9ACTN|nr:polysaccharide deacetylase family protein [Planobispora siamensis]GIH90030.1 hypothetical protein Psi01_06600 [Planobispora siamensis]
MKTATFPRAAWIPAVLALAALLLPLGAPARAEALAPKKPRTIVVLTFDDGDATHLAVARMLQKHGMRGTFYVNSATLGDEEKLTTRQLAAIAEAGHEIGGHTLNHTRLTELLPDQQRTQICDDRRALMKMGHRVTTLAYPFGSVDADAKRTAKSCGYNAARVVGGIRQWNCPACPPAESLPPADRWGVRSPGSFTEETQVRQMKQLVLNAEKTGGLIPLVFHRVCAGCGWYSNSPEDVEEFLGWLASRKSRGTVVKTMAEAIGGPLRPMPKG